MNNCFSKHKRYVCCVLSSMRAQYLNICFFPKPDKIIIKIKNMNLVPIILSHYFTRLEIP